MADMIPIPYQLGKSLKLDVLARCCDDLPLAESVTVNISHVYEITMSSVMQVTFTTSSGSKLHAILKLYDRRFGCDLRKITGKHVPLKPWVEDLFQSLVRQGRMAPFLQEMEEEQKASPIAYTPEDFMDDTPEGPVRYEAALWQCCVKYFDCETEVYARLKELQGKSIPKLYAHVRLPSDTELSPDLKQYTEIKGVLLELIPGFRLSDLPNSPLAPSDTAAWSGIVQSAVNAVHDINKHGILLTDCQPRNVVVHAPSLAPYIIDFAQCWFKERIVEEIDDDDDPDVDYWSQAITRDNPGAIGAVMATKVLRIKGIELEVQYPDCYRIIEEIEREKGHVIDTK